MNIRNCRNCKRLFNYVAGPLICGDCKVKLEEKFVECKKYIQDNPSANINAVAVNCDVEPNQIRQWIREERLMFSDSAGVGVECDRCGKTIQFGRYCSKCKVDMTNTLNSIAGKATIPTRDAVKQDDKRTVARMRFLEQ